MVSVSIENTATRTSQDKRSKPARLAPNYWPFVIPALVVIAAVIVFPWVFTLWMSAHRWTLGQEQSFIGFENYIRLASDARFWESLWHTLVYTVLSVVAPCSSEHWRRWFSMRNFRCADFCAASSSCR